jgi:hypothetical protein
MSGEWEEWVLCWELFDVSICVALIPPFSFAERLRKENLQIAMLLK